MVWFEAEEEQPLDTLNQANLWLWNGVHMRRGGYGQRLEPARPEWYDERGQIIRDITHWRAIMAWEVDLNTPPDPGEISRNPIVKKR